MRLHFIVYWTILPLLAPAQEPDKIDLVELGQETFHSLGCAECHSTTENDPSVRTGPGLYGLFQKTPRTRQIQESGEGHLHSLKANLSYFQNSLLNPTGELAIAETGSMKGQTYHPVMPPYPKTVVSEFQQKAIYQYLLTLNKPEHQGPPRHLVQDERKNNSNDPINDPAELLVTDSTRIFRARLANHSSRAIYVGTPSGLNYSFDPRTLSIESLWWGGFLNLEEELKGRAKKLSRMGHQAEEIPLSGSLLRPIHPTTRAEVDLSFKSPLAHDFETIGKHLNAKEDFLTLVKKADAKFLGYTKPNTPAGHPAFAYQINKNQIKVEFDYSADGHCQIVLSGSLQTPQSFNLAPEITESAKASAGQLTDSRWTIPAQYDFSASLSFTLPPPSLPWRPTPPPSQSPDQQTQPIPIPSLHLPKGYYAETIPPPLDAQGRPQLFEALGMDFSDDGTLFVSTRTAGIWKYRSGTWTQVAEGLLDALGLIVEDQKGHTLVVGQKAELTRLIDIDYDGKTDLFRTICDDFLSTSNYHEYLHGPIKDKENNLYFTLNLSERAGKEIHKAGGKWMGTQGGLRGWCLKVNPENKMTLFANGLRSPAGLGTSPKGRLYYTENQGEFVGTSKLFNLEQGKFYGHPASLIDLPHMTPTSPKISWKHVKRTREPALALLAHSRVANSPGSPAWDTTEGKFGPFSEQMFVGDQTLSNLFRVIPTIKAKTHEAVVIPFAQGFPSGVMRLAFAPDGSLYLGQTGRGWRSKGGKDHSLIRIVRDSPIENQLHNITRDGKQFTLTFTKPLPSTSSSDEIFVHSWTYKDSPKYGSEEHDKKEHSIRSVSISSDKKALTLTLSKRPPSNLGRSLVYRIQSKALPSNVGSQLKAFYSIVAR